MTSNVIVTTALNAGQLQTYSEEGYLIVRGLLSESDLAVVKRIHADEVEAANSARGEAGWSPKADDWDLSADGAMMVRKVAAPFDRFPDFRAIFTGAAVLDIVSGLIGPRIYLHSSKLMCKPAQAGRRKPWHQDLAYWDDMDSAQVTLWCAIDPATRANGCLQVIPGSHRRGLIQHEEIEDWQIREDKIDEENVVFAVMSPGDVLFLHPLTLHASGANLSSEPRLAALVNYYSKPRTDEQRSPYGSNIPLR